MSKKRDFDKLKKNVSIIASFIIKNNAMASSEKGSKGLLRCYNVLVLQDKKKEISKIMCKAGGLLPSSFVHVLKTVYGVELTG